MKERKNVTKVGRGTETKTSACTRKNGIHYRFTFISHLLFPLSASSSVCERSPEGDRPHGERWMVKGKDDVPMSPYGEGRKTERQSRWTDRQTGARVDRQRPGSGSERRSRRGEKETIVQ